MRWLQWLFRSRYVAFIESENLRLIAENRTIREWHAQITSSLLQGAGMPALELRKAEPTIQPKKKLPPSLWRRTLEQQDSRQVNQESKETN